MSGRRQTFCLKSQTLGHFGTKNQQRCGYLGQVSTHEKRSVQQTFYFTLYISLKSRILLHFDTKKSTILLIFGSDINACKMKRQANSLSHPLSLSPEHSSSLLNRSKWTPTDISSEKSNFTVFWHKKFNYSARLFWSDINEWKTKRLEQSLYQPLSHFPVLSSLLSIVFSGCRKTFVWKKNRFVFKHLPRISLF